MTDEETCVYRFNSAKNPKIAAFDLDHTVLCPKSGKKFAKNRHDARLVYPKVLVKLNELRHEGFKIVIFTNQLNRTGDTILKDILFKVDQHCGRDIDVFISIRNDQHRKPMPGMFDLFCELNGPVDKKSLLYVGDAAGRPKDFSDTDLRFALNIGAAFRTPEEYFLNEPVGLQYSTPKIPIREIAHDNFIPWTHIVPSKTMIIHVGRPACGKSTLSRTISEQYSNVVIVSNDATGSSSKSLRMCRLAIANPETNIIIIDNTNPSRKTRELYEIIADTRKYHVWILKHLLPKECCQYLNRQRSYTEKREAIPDVAYDRFDEYFKEPTEEEGRIIPYLPWISTCKYY
jgi:bifunctional polynucleotide phosphatase/kinase